MDAKLKAEWVRALRSGEYQQTTDALKDANGHCCLGVLCEVALKAGILDKSFIDVEREQIVVYPENFEGDPDRDAGETGELSPVVRDALGLRNEDEAALINRNDGLEDFRGARQDFLQIAKFIELEVA